MYRLALLIATFAPLAMNAQSAGAGPPADKLCFRAKPLPACGAFWITESGAALRISDNRSNVDGALVVFDAGLMSNRGRNFALGATVFGQIGRGVEGIGVRPRVRRWIGSDVSLDLAPGVIVYGPGGSPGASAQIALDYKGYVGFNAHVVAIRPHATDPDRELHVASFVGARAGGLPGAIGMAATAVGFVIFMGACLASGCAY